MFKFLLKPSRHFLLLRVLLGWKTCHTTCMWWRSVQARPGSVWEMWPTYVLKTRSGIWRSENLTRHSVAHPRWKTFATAFGHLNGAKRHSAPCWSVKCQKVESLRLLLFPERTDDHFGICDFEVYKIVVGKNLGTDKTEGTLWQWKESMYYST